MPPIIEILVWTATAVGACGVVLAAIVKVARFVKTVVLLVSEMQRLNALLPQLLRIGEELKVHGPDSMLARISHIDAKANEAAARVRQLTELTQDQSRVLTEIQQRLNQMK